MSSGPNEGQAQDRGDERAFGADVCSESLDKSSHDLQRKLRKIILVCLGILNVEDPRVAPALQRLSMLIAGFETRFRADISMAAGGMHWVKLKAAMKSGDSSLTAIKKRRILRRCEHGKKLWDCMRCRPCPHGNVQKSCEKCCGCPHGRLKFNCVKCQPCPHGKLKKNCSLCTGCPHGKLKKNCSLCAGCEHGRPKTQCKVCKLARQKQRIASESKSST